MGRTKEATMTLVFENDGKTVHKSTEGFQGKDCEKLTDFIEAALHSKDIERTHTDEYNKGDRLVEEDGQIA